MAKNSTSKQKQYDRERASSRSKVWLGVVYPESAPDNWQSIFDEEHLTWIEGPLHDKDINADGEVKKAHIHVILQFSSNKSQSQVTEIMSMVNAPKAIPCRNTRGAIRYLIHADNPEKAQYSKNDVKAHGGAVIGKALDPVPVDKSMVMREMMTWVVDNDIIDFADLAEYALMNNPDWFDVLTAQGGTFTMEKYITSRWKRWNRQQ